MTTKRAPRRPPKALVETALAWLRLQGKRGTPLLCDNCGRAYVEASTYADRNAAWTVTMCIGCFKKRDAPISVFASAVWAYVDDFKEAEGDGG